MWAGSRFAELKDFLSHNDFDILCFEEVAGVGAAGGNILSSRDFFTKDCFVELQSVLGEGYASELAIAQYMASNPATAYFGNAIFYKKEFSLLQKDVLPLYTRDTPFPEDAKTFEKVGRNVLHLTLEKEDKKFEILCAHLAWGTTKKEESHQTKQNSMLASYVQSLQQPWIAAGDFNIAPDQPSIIALEQYGHNLTKEHKVINTIDPTNHTRWEEFAPGEAIDYIFVSPDVQVEDFKVLDTVHMSDHYGLTATVII